MDPNECLRLFIEAVADKRFEDAEDYRDALAGWLQRGGFEPNWSDFHTTRNEVLQWTVDS